MNQQFSCSLRVCATCERWMGARQIDNFSRTVKTPQNTQGICYGGGFNQLPTNATASCAQFVQWRVLR